MSLAEIVKQHQANMRPCETVDEDFFNDAMDMSDETVDSLYEIYLAQDGVNRLSELVEGMTNAIRMLDKGIGILDSRLTDLERDCG